ncbi:MAG: hypothetical protein QF569_25945, partial [Candidatus Poribacteria bacterium]|nr:hypothetical protein [Candidatus Poribacteria bacterium]
MDSIVKRLVLVLLTSTVLASNILAITISAVAPATDAKVNHTKVSYTLSESISGGTITWTRTSGSADSTVHSQNLTGSELDTGAHTNIVLSNAPTLVSGAVYTISFDATDDAGNDAVQVNQTGVVFDTVAPTASLSYKEKVTNTVVTRVKQNTVVVITATLSEDMIASLDVKLTGSADGTAVAVSLDAMIRGSATSYSYEWTVGSGDGTITFGLSVGTDIAGNLITTSPTSGSTIIVDNTAPANQNSVFANDLAVNSSATTSVTIVSSSVASNQVWLAPANTTSFAVSNDMKMATDGVATSIDIPTVEGDYKLFIIDEAGNISSSSTATLTVDNTPPTASLSYKEKVTNTVVTRVKQNTVVVITATLSEDMADSPAPKIEANGANTISATDMTKVSSTEYTYSWTVGTGNGTTTFSLSVGTDMAENLIVSTPTSSTDTIIVDNTDPASFTTGSVEATGGRVLTGYWNDTNTAIKVTVPIATETAPSSLEGGTVQIQAKALAANQNDLSSGTFTDIPAATDGILITDIGNNKVLTISESLLTSLISSSEDDKLVFRAVITDYAGNETQGDANTTDIFIVDTTAPTNANVDSVYNHTTHKAKVSQPVSLTLTISSSGESTNQVWLAPPSTTDFIAASNMKKASDGVATSIVTPTMEGDYKLFIIDEAGNISSSSTATLTVDNTPPTASLSYKEKVTNTVVTRVKQNTVVVITATLSEDMADSPAPKIEANGANTISATDMTKVSSTEYTYSWTVGTGNGTTTFSLSVGTDMAENLIVSTPTSSTDTIIVDNTDPASFTTGSVEATGGRVLTGYWNDTNTAIKVTVPIATETAPSSLEGGTVQIQAKALAANQNDLSSGTFTDIPAATDGILITDIGNNKVLTISESLLTSLISSSEDDKLVFRAVITDYAGNETQGDANTTDIFIVDTTAPTNANVDSVYNHTTHKAKVSQPVSLTLTISSSGESTNQVWLAPPSTTDFIAASNMKKASDGVATSIVTPTVEGDYKLFIIDEAGNIS